jgi:aspartyl-tRNA(Asn)/glutamyl-tRNA(Gln) amidotransferase subunit B
VSAVMLGGMLKRIEDDTISGKIAKQIFEAMWNGEGDADTVINVRGLRQLTDNSTIEKLVETVILSNPDQVQQYKSTTPDKQGKLIGFFVGQIMKQSQGKANPKQVNLLLQEKLK